MARAKKKGAEMTAAARTPDRRRHHSVYVVYLRNPKGDGRAGYYVGMTGLTPEERFANHKAGRKDAGIVRRFGVRLVPKLYAHLNPMTYAEAVECGAEARGGATAEGLLGLRGTLSTGRKQ